MNKKLFSIELSRVSQIVHDKTLENWINKFIALGLVKEIDSYNLKLKIEKENKENETNS